MITAETIVERPGLPVDQRQSARDIGVHVPAQQHAFVEPMHRQQILAQNQLKIARTVEAEKVIVGGNDLVEVKIRPPRRHSRHRPGRVAAIK